MLLTNNIVLDAEVFVVERDYNNTVLLRRYFKDTFGRSISSKDRVIIFLRTAGCQGCRDELIRRMSKLKLNSGVVMIACPESINLTKPILKKCEVLHDSTCQYDLLPFSEIVTLIVFMKDKKIQKMELLSAELVPAIVGGQ
ncbi:MAG: hypothetical protein HYX66_01745 [Ignavibacteria bacterium]|nr:hypothetical protein [Ignavibacteria bacterium]